MAPVLPSAAVVALLSALGAAPSRGEVVQAAPGSFEVRFEGAVAATPAVAFQAMTELPRWWSPAHTWSGDAGNMRLDAVAGGCWCEAWGDGASVQHARVLSVLPGRMLLLRGSLGPLQDLPVTGLLKLQTQVQDGQTRLHLSYRVGGPGELALQKWAPVVDGVIGEQFQRLRAFIDGVPKR
jgi:uncharacterized protein YndB with AHSA1/START domain